MKNTIDISIKNLLLVPCMLTMLMACGDDVTNNYTTEAPVADIPPVVAQDTDDDGLTDEEELRWGTSIRLSDTDGDGFSDFTEIIEFGFNPNNNNFRFNPLIADVPKLSIELTSVPEVSLKYTTTANDSTSQSVTRTQESASTITTSETSTNSIATEETHSVGVEASFEAGPGGGVSGSVSYDYSHSTTTSASFSHTALQSEENRRSIAQGEAFERSNGIKHSGGELEITLRIRNDGDLSFRLDNLVLGAVMVDPLNSGQLLPIANLNIDSRFEGFPVTTLAPKQSTGNLIFDNPSLSLDEAKALLRDASSLIIDVALSEVVDQEGVAFAFSRTEIGLKTATVIIDFGGYRASERYLVATNVNAETQRVSMDTIMNQVLLAPYSTNDTGILSSVRGVAENAGTDAYWVVVIISDNGLELSAETYSTLTDPYDFNALTLKSGDVLQLTYMEDSDGDGLGLRREFLIGTNPELPDTDGDEISDGVEVEGYQITVDRGDGEGPVTSLVRSNPLIKDTDDDDLSDLAEMTSSPPTNPSSVDTDSDGLLDSFDRLPTIFQSLDIGQIVVDKFLDSVSSSNPPVIILTWPNAPSLTSGEALELVVRRQEVNIGESFLKISDPLTGACSDGSICFPELYRYDDITFQIVNDHPASPLVLRFDKDYKYLFYLMVDGNPVLLDSITVDTATSQQSITINIKEIYVETCIDTLKAVGIPNLVCELFWEFDIGGQILLSREEIDEIDAVTGQSISPIGDMTFNVANLPGSCFTLTAKIWESDTSVNSTKVGDDLLRPITETLCYPTWGSNSGIFERSAVHDQSGSYREFIDLTMYFEVILNP